MQAAYRIAWGMLLKTTICVTPDYARGPEDRLRPLSPEFDRAGSRGLYPDAALQSRPIRDDPSHHPPARARRSRRSAAQQGLEVIEVNPRAKSSRCGDLAQDCADAVITRGRTLPA